MADNNAAAAGTIAVGDLTVNRLGFGAMRVTGRGVWGEPPDVDQAKEVLRRAVDLGVNFIDTADSYGPEVSESLIAQALHPYPDDLVVATKAGMERPGPGQWVPNGRPEHLRQACEGSLQRLKVEQIKVYQLHRPDPKVPLAESVGALVELQREGKVRHIGLSNVTEAQLREAERLTPIVSIQNRLNVADRSSEQVLDVCTREGKAFLPWAPIQDAEGNGAIAAAARRLGAEAQQVVIAWLLGRSPAMLPIPGTGSVEHLEANVAAAGLRLTDEEVEAISAAAS
jgi:pyridoxine 4-dehydrogenase